MKALVSHLSRISPYWWLSMACLLGLMLLFGDLFFHPNQYYFSHAGDGFTPYFSIAFYAKYGGGSWVDLHNYPHGNHLLYIAAPLIAWIVKGLSLFGDAAAYTPAIINLSVMLSFFPGVWLLYAILRRNLLPVRWAMGFALLILFFSPQLLRITGYYGLAYPCFVPLLWYALLLAFEDDRYWFGLSIYGSSTLIFSLLHPYYAMLGAAFLPVFVLVQWVQFPGKWRKRWGLLAGSLLAAIGPGLLLRSWEILSSRGARDFVEVPYGFLQYIAGFETIFVPQLEPFRTVWDQIIPLRKIGWEGNAYVGLVGLIILLSFLFRIYQHIREKKYRRIWRPVLPTSLRSSIWVAVLLLIPAMAHPFQWFPGLLDYLGPLQQFRAIGRLAWIFYSIYLVFCVWYLYALYRLLKIKDPSGRLSQLGKGLVALAICSWGINLLMVGKSQRKEFLANDRSQFFAQKTDFRALLAETGHEAADFQAILSLPYYHFGSEKILAQDWPSTEVSLAASLQTGLPMCNNRSARASLSETLANVQLVSHPLIHKELIEQFPNQKPLLLLYRKGADLSPGESLLQRRSELLAESGDLALARLELEDFADGRTGARTQFKNKQPKLRSFGNVLLSHTTQAVYFESYGDDATVLGGQTQPTGRDSVILFDGRLPTRWPNTKMELSFWVKIETNTNYLGHLHVQEFDESGLVQDLRHSMPYTKDVYQNWVKITLDFLHPSAKHRLLIWAEEEKLTIDNVLIRPRTVDVYAPGSNSDAILYNNYVL